MKKDNVSQDDENIFGNNCKSIQYATDEKGNYVQVKSVGLEPSNIILKQAWEEVGEEVDFALKEVMDGNKSPIYYFMKKEIMDVKILSETTGLSRWRITRHLKPKVFFNLSDSILNKYKVAFKLKSIMELKNFRV